jgi:hypothetical protein
MRVLISGASIAGPTLAYWLDRYGFDVTVVELAPALRQGGYAVDFRGGVQLAVLERMGLLEQVRGHQTGGHPARFVDETGATVLSMPREFTGGNLEIQRTDLSRLLYDHSRERVEYRFGDSIAEQGRAWAGFSPRGCSQTSSGPSRWPSGMSCRMMPRIGAAYRTVGTFTFCCRAVPRSWMSCSLMCESTKDRTCGEP